MVFSHRIENEAPKALSQKSSGRCWIFAALNALRVQIIRKYKLEDSFELSQTYLFWADKIEKCNYFLEAVLEVLERGSDEERALDGRLFQWLLQAPVQDGGQWDMIVALIRKYGLLPKNVFPEAHNSTSSGDLRNLLTGRLREFARELREMHSRGASLDALRSEKTRMLSDLHRILTICLGDPPETFDWVFRDKDKKAACLPGMTPHRFAEEVAEVPRWVYPCVSLINDSRNPYYQTYTVRFLGSVWEAPPVLYLNLPIERLEVIARDSLVLRNRPVWYGCDVGKRLLRTSGLMSTAIWDYELAFSQAPPGVSNKADRLCYGDSSMTHAMVLTGVNLVDPSGAMLKGQIPTDSKKDTTAEDIKPAPPILSASDLDKSSITHWRVENSWGDEIGTEKGFFSMTRDWFREFAFQIVVEREALDAKEDAALRDTTPIVLPPWDPMGALA